MASRDASSNGCTVDEPLRGYALLLAGPGEKLDEALAMLAIIAARGFPFNAGPLRQCIALQS
jgi:hypothetical protein